MMLIRLVFTLLVMRPENTDTKSHAAIMKRRPWRMQAMRIGFIPALALPAERNTGP